jgi:hypothetical protein
VRGRVRTTQAVGHCEGDRNDAVVFRSQGVGWGSADLFAVDDPRVACNGATKGGRTGAVQGDGAPLGGLNEAGDDAVHLTNCEASSVDGVSPRPVVRAYFLSGAALSVRNRDFWGGSCSNPLLRSVRMNCPQS